MPRTESPKKRSGRFCGDCGYELARDNDGTCPMCSRFKQLRSDLTVPRPSDLAAHRAKARDTSVSAAPDEWPPTVAEYRAILDERRVGSTSTDQSRGRVIRTPALRQTRVPQLPGAANAAGPLMRAATVRHAVTRSRAGATRPWLVPVAVVAGSALIGFVVPILLSLF